MEIGTSEGKPSGLNREISEGEAREFIQSLPPEGIMLHGTFRRNIKDIRKKGLLLSPQLRSVYGLFLKININPSSDEYSPNDIEKIMKDLKTAVWNCTGYGMRGTGHDNKDDNMPAVVIAKLPSGIIPLRMSHSGLPEGRSDKLIPAGDILAIESLTLQEYLQIPKEEKFWPKPELINIMVKKIINSIINENKNNIKPAGNILQRVIGKLSKQLSSAHLH
ncbi:MAG: hypothetical protein Q7R31_00590 [Candidatus Levybacteria bacterium]|nr:hypothetical protein [Candidatus Levybacteria bacterium]